MSKPLDFSVVIPTFDRVAELGACLRQLAPGAQTLAAERYEVIVTSDGVDFSTAPLGSEFPWVRWTTGPRRGPAANRNHGAAQAAGAWVAFCDDDCVPETDWLAQFLARIQSNPTMRVGEGRTYADRPRRSCFETAPINEHGGNLWSCNFAIERATFVALGGFNERFPHAAMEDVEFRLRLEQAGVPIVFCPGAAVMHPWRLQRDVARHRRAHLASVLVFNTLHPDRAVTRRSHAHLVLRRYGKEMWRDLAAFGWDAVVYYSKVLRADLADFFRLPARGS